MNINIDNLRTELLHLCEMRNNAHYDESRAFWRYYNENDPKKADGLEKSYDLAYDHFEMYDDKLHANAQLLRRVLGFDVHWKENNYGYITEITIDFTPHIGDTIIIDVQIPLYITRWIESEQERILPQVF